MTDYLSFPGDILLGVASAGSAERRQEWNAIVQVGAQLAWSQARPQFMNVLPALLGRGDLLGSGWTLYEIELGLAEQVRLGRRQQVASVTGAIPMQIRLGPNVLTAKSTTPTVFGPEGDPKFSLDFVIVIDFSLFVVPERMFIQAQVESAHNTGPDGIGDPHLDSGNVVADLAIALAGVVSPFFGGPNYLQMVETLVGQQDFAGLLNQALQPVNDGLGQLAAQGMGAVAAFFPDAAGPGGLYTAAVNLGVTAPPESAPLVMLATAAEGDGVIRGCIRWPLSQGEPALALPYLGAFTLSASVDRGAMTREFSQPTDVTRVAGFDDASTDTECVIEYELAQLPLNEPITVECRAEPGVAWTGSAASVIRQVQHDGWDGRVTVRPAIRVLGGLNAANTGANRLGGFSSQVTGPVDQPGPPPFGTAGQVELNLQSLPPGHALPLGSLIVGGGQAIAETASGAPGGVVVTNDQPQVSDLVAIPVQSRNDPTGSNPVENVDFRVEFVSRPS